MKKQSYVQESNVADFYKFEEVILKFHGIWPNFNKTMAKSIFHTFQKWLTIFISGSFLLSLTIDIYLKANSLEEITDSSYYFVTQLTYILKLTCFFLKYEKFKILVSGEHDLLGGNRQSTKPWLHLSTFVTKYFLLLCYITFFFYATKPFIDDSLLPLGGYFPWNIQQSLMGRIAAHLFQVFGILIGVNVNAELDTLVVSLILASCWQIKLLKNNLNEISNDLTGKEIEFHLIQRVKHHLAIIQYVEQVENIFGMGLFFQFVTSGATLCITGFQLMITPIYSAKFLTLITYLIAIFVQISAYCWAGQQIITESNDLSYSCYTMDWWYENIGSKDAKVALYLMMERCKKPISIRAGYFFTLSINTLATIIRTSYSVFALMRKVHVEDVEL